MTTIIIAIVIYLGYCLLISWIGIMSNDGNITIPEWINILMLASIQPMVWVAMGCVKFCKWLNDIFENSIG